MTDDGMRALSGVKTLLSLDLCGCSRVTDAGLHAVAGLPELVALDLSW